MSIKLEHFRKLFALCACLCTSLAADKLWTPVEVGQAGFSLSPDQVLPYKTVDKKGTATALHLHFFLPEGHQATDCRPAVVFFHGGGWHSGTPDHVSTM